MKSPRTRSLVALGAAVSVLVLGSPAQADNTSVEWKYFPTTSLNDTGGIVVGVQTAMKGLGLYSGNIDGIFGSGTRSAVMSFQSSNTLTADGVVGTNTWGKIQLYQTYYGVPSHNRWDIGSSYYDYARYPALSNQCVWTAYTANFTVGSPVNQYRWYRFLGAGNYLQTNPTTQSSGQC